jgi:hypothetical protein
MSGRDYEDYDLMNTIIHLWVQNLNRLEKSWNCGRWVLIGGSKSLGACPWELKVPWTLTVAASLCLCLPYHSTIMFCQGGCMGPRNQGGNPLKS